MKPAHLRKGVQLQGGDAVEGGVQVEQRAQRGQRLQTGDFVVGDIEMGDGRVFVVQVLRVGLNRDTARNKQSIINYISKDSNSYNSVPLNLIVGKVNRLHHIYR